MLALRALELALHARALMRVRRVLAVRLRLLRCRVVLADRNQFPAEPVLFISPGETACWPRLRDGLG